MAFTESGISGRTTASLIEWKNITESYIKRLSVDQNRLTVLALAWQKSKQ